MCPAGGEQALDVYALGGPSVDKYMKFSLCKEKDKWKRRREIEEEEEENNRY